MNYINFPLYRYIEACLLSLSPFSMIYIPCWHIARLVIFPQPFMGEIYILRLASYLLNSGAFNSIADAEICHSGDICKIFRSRYCVWFTVLNLQVLKVYAYKPVKNFAFKNHLLNSLSCVRTLICKTVQISVDRTSILLVLRQKKNAD